MAPVGPNRQKRAHFDLAVRSSSAHSGNSRAIDDQIRPFRLHEQAKSWIGFGLLRDEIQKIPLRHQPDELAMRWEV